MTTFIQLHILTSYPASNLNRDDTGRPKSLNFGGAERIRISSQSLKRAFRTSDIFVSALPNAIGTRSKGFADVLLKKLIEKGLQPEIATKRVADLIQQEKLGKTKPQSTKTEQLVHLSPEELNSINELADALFEAEKVETNKPLILTKAPKAADIAMFGRMLADASGYNVEAAVQVAHAFTTHRATIEDDFFTAVDDIKNADANEDAGAGHLGEQYFGAGVFYLYINIDANLLVSNLEGDKSLAKTAIAAFIKAATQTSPSGKQNSYASRAYAQFVLEEIGSNMPRTLGVAFQNPIGVKGENNYVEASKKRIISLKENFERIYGESNNSLIMDEADKNSKTLQDLVDAALNAIDEI